jgi:glyoxylase-like metal-dependent hydrolase (beta-lactamase superfamily II)/8-oxo-dGTP pyrophosphatase MutT (NUDIX family)
MPVAPPAVRPPKDAAVTIVYRQVPGAGVEVFWLRRETQLSFAGGFYAFPGGRVDAADAQIPMEGAEGPEAQLRVAAARELFEETGLLLAAGAEKVGAEERGAARAALLDRKESFAQVVQRLGLQLRARDFLSAGRWITPPFMPIRFDAHFFLAEAPPTGVAEVWPGEAAEGAWVKPKDALKRWQAGTALLHPPNLHALQVMEGFQGVDDAVQKLANPPYCPNHVASRIEMQKGVLLFPLETPTLPPATHTNCYLLGNGELLIVDPGAAEVRQYARLLALVEGLKAEGKRPVAIFVTHHHADHVGGVQAVQERLGIPVWCHERTAERLGVKVDRLIADSELITLQGVPAMHWRALHTPGHARGHLCLMDEASRAVICGDMVSGVSTIVIDPPEGDMTDYLQQLERLRALPAGVLYPAHGPPMPDGPAKLLEYLHHREMREKKVLEAIGPAGSKLVEIVPRAYDDVPEAIHPIAERSAQAILIKLVREQKVERRDDTYLRLAAPAGR